MWVSRVSLLLLCALVVQAGIEIGVNAPEATNGPPPVSLGQQFTYLAEGMAGFRYASVVGEKAELLAVPEPMVENAATENDCNLTMDENTGSGFMFSESYRPSDEQCTSSTQVPCYGADEQVSAPNTGLYTRFTFSIENTIADLGVTQTIDQEFDYVASDIGSTCATLTTECEEGSACDGIFETLIEVKLTNLKIGYRLQRMCFTPGGMTSSSFSSCPFGFSYLPLGSNSTLDAACTALGVGAKDCFAEEACLASYSGQTVCDDTLPCDSSVVGAPLDTSILDTNCGANRDADTNFIDELNQQCVSACYSPCASEGFTDPQYHQRWVVGPYSYGFNILPADRFLADLEITVKVLNETGQPAVVRTVSLTNIDEGTVALDSTGQVRVTINSIATEVFNAAPKLSQGMIVLWDDAGATSNGIVFETASPEINPNSLLPNNGFGLTPTKRNYNSTHGWAWLNSTKLYGPSPGQYGASQEMETSPTAQFGALESGYNGYYDSNHLLPSFQMQKDYPTLPVVESPCYMSDKRNTLTDQVLGAVPPDQWVGTEYCLPNTDLSFGNWYLYGNLLVYDVRTEASNGDPDFLVTGGSGWTDNVERLVDLFQVQVDVSADLARYSPNVGGAAYGAASGCLFDVVEGMGEFVVSITNTNLAGTSTTTFSVETTCTTTDTSVLAVTDVEPMSTSIALSPGSTRYLQPNTLFQLQNITGTTYDEPPTVYCSSEIFAESASTIPLSTKTFQCFNARAGIATNNGSRIAIAMDHRQECDGSTAECETMTYWWIWIAIIVIAALFVLLVVGLILYCCLHSREKKKQKQEAIEMKKKQ